MNFSGKHFEFAGTSSKNPLGDGSVSLIFAHIDTEMFNQPFGYPEYSSVYSGRLGRRGLTGTKRNESCLEIEAEIVSEKGGIPLNKLRTIEQWLFSREGFDRLYIASDEEDAEDRQTLNGVVLRLYLNCMLTEPEILTYAEGRVGWKVKIVCDAPWAWQEATYATCAPTSATPSASFTVPIYSDINSYIYPDEVYIRFSNSLANTATRTVRLYNTSDSDSRITEFSLPGNIMQIYILNTGVVATARSSGTNLLPYMAQRNFPRLVSYYDQSQIGLNGNNSINVTTSAVSSTGSTLSSKVSEVTYRFRNRRFLS